MQTFDIDGNKQFVISRERRTRKVTVKQNAGATKDYPSGLLLTLDNNKFVPATTNALCALVDSIPKADIVAGDVVAEVVYYAGVGKEKIMFSNDSIRITEKFIEASLKNKLDIKSQTGDVVVKIAELVIGGELTNTQYTETAVDLTGLTFKVKYTDGTEKSILANQIVSTPSSWGEDAGDQTAILSYLEDGYTVSAELEATVELDVPVSLAVSGDWTNAQVHETAVDPTGLIFGVTYASGDSKDVTADVTVSPETWGETIGEQTATFSYTEAGITVSAEKEATVVLDVPASLAITGTLTNAQTVSTAPDITGLTATATYLSGKTADVTANVTVSPALYGETAGTETLTLSYTEGGATVSDSIEVTVTE